MAYTDKRKQYLSMKRCFQRRRIWHASLKEGKPCCRCGKEYPSYVMDWHHRDPSAKSFSIGKEMTRHSRAEILKEIEKCDLLCANCHRIVEHEKLNSGENGIQECLISTPPPVRLRPPLPSLFSTTEVLGPEEAEMSVRL